MDELLPEPLHVGLSSDDDGHGVLRGLDQGKLRVNEQLGHLGRRVPPSATLPRSLFKGSGKMGVGKSEARTSRASSPRSAGSVCTQTSVDLTWKILS